MFLALLALGKLSGSLSLSGMLDGALAHAWPALGAALIFVMAGLFIVLLAENCRIPFDDPNTHLELTMIHEVMVLDHSGPGLGLVLYGAAVKLMVLGAVVIRVALPFGTDRPWLDWSLFAVAMLLLSVLIGVVESVMARLRLVHVPNLLIAACLLCGFGFLLLVR
jgi:formate hydrogenlyase subunit 4